MKTTARTSQQYVSLKEKYLTSKCYLNVMYLTFEVCSRYSLLLVSACIPWHEWLHLTLLSLLLHLFKTVKSLLVCCTVTRPLNQPHGPFIPHQAPNLMPHLCLPTYSTPPVTSTHHLLISVTSVMSYKCRPLWHMGDRRSLHAPLRLNEPAGG